MHDTRPGFRAKSPCSLPPRFSLQAFERIELLVRHPALRSKPSQGGGLRLGTGLALPREQRLNQGGLFGAVRGRKRHHTGQDGRVLDHQPFIEQEEFEAAGRIPAAETQAAYPFCCGVHAGRREGPELWSGLSGGDRLPGDVWLDQRDSATWLREACHLSRHLFGPRQMGQQGLAADEVVGGVGAGNVAGVRLLKPQG